jgi:integration host factor subunit beta
VTPGGCLARLDGNDSLSDLQSTRGAHDQITIDFARGRANPRLYVRDAEKVVNVIFDGVSAALARGDRVELRGFGVFSVKTQSARTGRNPKTGASVSVPEKWYPTLRTGREMHARLNGTSAGDLLAAFHKAGDVAKP